MNEIVDKKRILTSLFWKFMERVGTQLIQFIIQIVLARLLLPKDYGLIALIIIFIAIANVFIQSGLNTALIQKKDADDLDFSSVFYLSLLISSGLYIILFFTAPLIGDYYAELKIVPVLRVLSIILFFGAVNSIQNAKVAREMQFKRLFFSSLGGVVLSGITGITMAFCGLGVWALVGQQLTNNLIVSIILWFTVKWRPKLIFSSTRIKSLFSFGWKLLFSSLLDTVYNNVYGLVIGKIYNPQMLGFYNQGNQFPSLVANNINGSIQSVMLPALSANQDDLIKLKRMVRRSIVTSSFLMFPVMIGLAVCAGPIVKIILTDKWLPCVPFLQLLSLSYVLWPIHTANLQAINALGRSDIFLKLEIIKKCIGIAALCISIPFGIYMMVGLQPVVSLISALLNAAPNRKLIEYGYKEQMMDIVPSLLLSVLMGTVVYGISFTALNIWMMLMLQVSVGLLLYIVMSKIFKIECLSYLLNTFSTFLKKQA